ncbi:MAG: hypothetical protein KatS3mg001_285 [Candidatus Pacearchaeota archaeon]|nr:MAG: hypothetical protein KatS3mg001_285 [Candidatus Pacearchaeota archaeon]
MLESIVNPTKKEHGPLKMFFVGLIYASLSLLLVKWFFSQDPVLSKYSGIIVVTFCVIFSMPFIFYIIKKEEQEDERVFGFLSVWEIHKDAIFSFLWLFFGFIVAFSFWYIFIGDSSLLNAQIETYCRINRPNDISGCIEGYDFSKNTGASIKEIRLLSIIENNIYVMIFTLLLSLIFGAGAIFVLAWNASVISAAIAIFTDHSIKDIPLGILRYMIHGFPEIAAYFIAALAGGIFGVGVLRNGIKSKKFLHVVENTIMLIFMAILIIILAALMEVYLTPLFF